MKRSQPTFCHPHQLRLSSGDAHHYISEQLAHLLSNATEEYRCNRQIVSDMVVKASVTGAAIEGTCNALTDAPTGMTVRSRLNSELSVTELQEIECKMQTMLKIDLPKRLWKCPLDLAMDFHDENFGRQRLLSSIWRHRRLEAQQLAGQILWDVRRFVGLADQSDDITVVVVKAI